MTNKLRTVGMFSLALSPASLRLTIMMRMITARASARAVNAADEAHDRGYRRVEVQSVRSTGQLEWEVTMQARDRSGRDVRIRCQYDARNRRARLT